MMNYKLHQVLQLLFQPLCLGLLQDIIDKLWVNWKICP